MSRLEIGGFEFGGIDPGDGPEGVGIERERSEVAGSELRSEGGFPDLTTPFQNVLDQPMYDQISMTSNFFQLKAIVQIDTVRLTYYSVLSRSPNGGPVTTILRSQGTY